MKKITTLLVLFAVLAAFTGCSKSEKSDAGESSDNSRSAKPVSIVYVEWDCARAASYVMKVVLEEEGYEVKLNSSVAAMMWQGLKTGSQDAMVCAWLPTTHADYYADALEGDVEDLGVNYENAKIGLVVPSYVTIDSIEEMKANADKFNGEIIGIDPGAGIMKKSDKALEEYGLDNFELVSSSGAAMTSTLAQKIKKEEWVAVTGWAPHWKFAKWDLKFLEDPKGVYGAAEEVHTIVRDGFSDDNPGAAKILANFYWTSSQIGELMAMNQVEGTDPLENAKKWIEKNRDVVNTWLEK